MAINIKFDVKPVDMSFGVNPSVRMSGEAYGLKGDPGTTFTPSVSEEGVISWTNDGGKENPTPVNIKGPKGDQGDTPDISGKADKADTVLETTLSRGRKANTTVGTGSIAFGYNVEASGSQSQAFGNATKASGSYARSEGSETIASGPYSTAEGYRSVARSTASHAEGIMSTANGSAAHSEGSNSKADGSASHSGGTGTVASHRSQHSFGEYNITDQSTAPATDRGTYIEIVGNGTGNNARSNARTLDWSGNEELAGDLTINKGSTNESSMSDVAEDVNSLKSAIDSVTNDENLFNTSTATDGKRINGSGGLNDDNTTYTSDYIPVKPGMYYYVNYPVLDIRHRVAIYNSSKVFISNELYEQNYVKIPASGAYIRFCGLLTEKSTAKAVWMSANDYVFRNLISELVSLSNILTGTTWGSGWVSQTSGNITANDSYTTTDYIAVTGGKYIVSCLNNARCEMFTIAVYDSSKNVIAGSGATGNGTQGLSGYFILPINAAYVKITYRTSVYSSSIIVYQYDYNIGYNPSDFYNIKEQALLPVYAEIAGIKSEAQSKWHGKTMLSVGDSQTAQNKWQPFVSSFLGMSSLVQGFSGMTVAVSNPNNVGNCLSSNYIMGQIDSYLSDKDFDVLLFMGGTNDWRYDGVKHEGYSNILIGENTDMTNTTFKGALKTFVSHFQAEYPTKTIVLMSNIGGRSIDAGTDTPATNMTAPLENNNGYTQATFAQATKEMAEYLGVPYIDVYDCGINIYNTASYLQDGLHINSTTGAKKVADCVISGLTSIQPYCS